MKILVSGANSLVGSHVAESLASHGHEVVGTFRRHNERVRLLAENSLVEMKALDLSCADDFKRLDSNFEAVVHNALQCHAMQCNAMSCNATCSARSTWLTGYTNKT